MPEKVALLVAIAAALALLLWFLFRDAAVAVDRRDTGLDATGDDLPAWGHRHDGDSADFGGEAGGGDD